MAIIVTAAIIRALSTKEKPELVAPLVAAMNEFFPQYEIITEKRVEHFLAQAAHESDGFHTLEEYASGDAYDTRVDLGNTKEKDGDGARYKGRGIFQTTGKTNYAAAGKIMGIDALAHPELLEEPRYAVWAACIYWKSRSLNALADKDDVLTISKKINGVNKKTGLPNGLDDRMMYLARVRKLVKETTAADPDDPLIGEDSPRELVKVLQKLLDTKAYNPGAIDGRWGKLTRAAVLALKADNHLDTATDSILLSQAKAAPQRVIETRQDATVADLRAQGSETIKGADNVQRWTIGGMGASALGWLSQAEVASGTWARVKGVLEPFEGLMPWIYSNALLLAFPAGGTILYFVYRARQKRLAEYKTGKMG